MLEHLIEHYGYLALFIGTFLEGETILIIAGAIASSPDPPMTIGLAILAAFAGSLSGDQAAFLLARWKGQWLLAKMPHWRPKIDKGLELLERNSTWLLLTFRFFYGLRNMVSLSVGFSHVPAWRFFALNSCGAMIWAVSFGMAGYVFGRSMQHMVENIHIYMLQVWGAIFVLCVLIWAARKIIRVVARRKYRRLAAEEKQPVAPQPPLPQAAQAHFHPSQDIEPHETD
ncbi:MAG: DedA family protein [Planctomycetes bacterium]|nr:DedA family protein [Planctomycetota bacterium]